MADSNMSEEEKERQKDAETFKKVQREILTTELTYLNGLRSAHAGLILLKKKFPKNTEHFQKGIDLTQTLITLHEKFLEAMDPEKNQKIGAAIGLMEDMKKPYADYLVFSGQQNTLMNDASFKNKYDLFTKSAAFLTQPKISPPEYETKLIEKLKQPMPPPGFESALIQPVQRVPRYELLFKECLKRSPKNEKYEQYLAKSKEVGNFINEKKREQEKKEAMQYFQSFLAKKNPKPAEIAQMTQTLKDAFSDKSAIVFDLNKNSKIKSKDQLRTMLAIFEKLPKETRTQVQSTLEVKQQMEAYRDKKDYSAFGSGQERHDKLFAADGIGTQFLKQVKTPLDLAIGDVDAEIGNELFAPPSKTMIPEDSLLAPAKPRPPSTPRKVAEQSVNPHHKKFADLMKEGADLLPSPPPPPSKAKEEGRKHPIGVVPPPPLPAKVAGVQNQPSVKPKPPEGPPPARRRP